MGSTTLRGLHPAFCIPYLAMPLALLPSALIPWPQRTDQLPLAVEGASTVLARVHAVAVAVVLVAQRAAAGQPDQVPEFLPALAVPVIALQKQRRHASILRVHSRHIASRLCNSTQWSNETS